MSCGECAFLGVDLYRVAIGWLGSRGGGRGYDLRAVRAGRYRAKKSSDYLREGAVRMQIGCVYMDRAG